MKCNFKKPAGDKCGLPSLKNGNFCCLHDPDTMSIYFIKDFKNHKKGEVIYGISKEESTLYLKAGVVLKVDRFLYRRINK